jgi:lipoyl synthase
MEIKKLNPGIIIELLIPDIQSPERILNSAPDVIGHNLETVPAFYPALRPAAGYKKSLNVLENIKKQSPNTLTKSGIMLGLGETRPQITAVMDDLRQAGCDIMTMGQYLRPSPGHYPVKEYITPELFDELGKTALEKGFRAAASGPLVRSSYKAHEIFMEAKNGKL